MLVHASLRYVYQVTEVVHALESTCYIWQYHGCWCTDTLCIHSLQL